MDSPIQRTRRELSANRLRNLACSGTRPIDPTNINCIVTHRDMTHTAADEDDSETDDESSSSTIDDEAEPNALWRSAIFQIDIE